MDAATPRANTGEPVTTRPPDRLITTRYRVDWQDAAGLHLGGWQSREKALARFGELMDLPTTVSAWLRMEVLEQWNEKEYHK